MALHHIYPKSSSLCCENHMVSLGKPECFLLSDRRGFIFALAARKLRIKWKGSPGSCVSLLGLQSLCFPLTCGCLLQATSHSSLEG